MEHVDHEDMTVCWTICCGDHRGTAKLGCLGAVPPDVRYRSGVATCCFRGNIFYARARDKREKWLKISRKIVHSLGLFPPK